MNVVYNLFIDRLNHFTNPENYSASEADIMWFI